MWNLIRMTKDQRGSTTDDIHINTLEQYYKDKFQDDGMNSTTTREAHSRVYSKYQNMEGKYMDYTLHEERLQRYINTIKAGCASGIDGIVGEHLKYAAHSDFIINQLCVMFTLCLRFGVVPTSFTSGLLIPLLKKPTCDPSIPKNYRPVVVSTAFSKILEMYILEECVCHDIEDAHFGFVPRRGTNMAISVT